MPSNTQPGVPDGSGPASRRSLLIAVAVLMMLMLVLSATARPFGLKPAALIGVPVAIIAATSLLLVLLVLAGPQSRDEAAAQAERAVELAFTPAVAVDPSNGAIVAANTLARELLGERRGSVGRHFSELLADQAPPDCRRVVLSAVEQGSASAQYCPIRLADRSSRGVRIDARRMTFEEEQVVVVAFIPDESGQAITEFSRVQERLMSNISHELRTPLNVVMGFAELMTTGTLGEMAANQLDAAQEIYVGGQRILNIVTDILDIGRVRSYYQPGEPRALDVGEIVHRVETLLVGQARRAEVKLDVAVKEGLPTVHVPERPLKQILYHLLLDRIDAGGPGDVVRVAVEGDGAVRVVVTDGGSDPDASALEPWEMPQLSDEEARTAAFPPATGLKLCAALVGALGAGLSLHTDADGHHFVLELPEAELVG